MDAHNREHIVLLRPGRHGLILHTLSHQDEVRAEDEFHTDTAPIPSRELDLARLLIEALAAGFEPTLYPDRYRQNLRLNGGQDPRPGLRRPSWGAGVATGAG